MFTISIHALVKRATRKAALPYLDTIISIHALVKRATKYEEVGYYFFNISIHALVKRATVACFPVPPPPFHFNPRPRKEGDWLCQGWCYNYLYFNPRPHKEGDVCFAHRRECHYNISIHALVKRATHRKEKGSYRWYISIHALVKRATIFVKRKSRKSDFGILPSNIISKRTFLWTALLFFQVFPDP